MFGSVGVIGEPTLQCEHEVPGVGVVEAIERRRRDRASRRTPRGCRCPRPSRARARRGGRRSRPRPRTPGYRFGTTRIVQSPPSPTVSSAGGVDLLVARAERARSVRSRARRARLGAKSVGRMRTLGDDRHPPARQLIQPHLAHRRTQDRALPARKLTRRATAVEIVAGSSRSQAVDRHVTVRRRRRTASRSNVAQRCSSVKPAAIAIAIELVGRRVPDRPRPEPDAAGLGELDELALGELASRDRWTETDRTTRSAVSDRTDTSVDRSSGVVGDERLDDEPARRGASRRRPRGSSRPGASAVVEVEQRVVGDERRAGTGRWAAGPPCRRSSRLHETVGVAGGQAVEHRRLVSRPVDRDDALAAGHRQRHREPAGADAQLEHRPAVGEVEQRRRRWRRCRRCRRTTRRRRRRTRRRRCVSS